MLIDFDLYPGLIIHNTSGGYVLQDGILTVQSGHSIWSVAQDLENIHGLDIWHRFIGLPGSVGGAVYGNAGCFGLEVANQFESCLCVDLQTGKQRIYTREDMDFSYRYSQLKKDRHMFCVEVTFDLYRDEEKYTSSVDNVYFREHQQPK